MAHQSLSILKVFYRPEKKLLLEVHSSNIWWQDHDFIFFKKLNEKEAKYLRIQRRWRFNFKYGFFSTYYYQLASNKVPHIGIKINLPTPWRFWLWGKFGVWKNIPETVMEWLDLDMPMELLPLSLGESRLHGALGTCEFKRIEALEKNLTFIESRNDGLVKLFKDKTYNRFFQLVAKPESKTLLEVTLPQWTYEYGERKEGLVQELSDEEFYENLEEDPRHKKCAENDCDKLSVRFSSYCRDHHFLFVKGRLYQPNSGEVLK